MGKKKAWRGIREKGTDLTAKQIREIAHDITKIAVRLNGIADDMDALSIPVLRPTTGYKTDIKALRDKVEEQFEDRLVKAVKQIATADHAAMIKQKYATRP